MNNYTSEEIQIIKEQVEKMFLSNPTWKSVGISMKETKGEVLPIPAITLYVEEKKDVSALDVKDLFPKTVDLGTKVIATDVKVIKSLDVIAFSSCYTLPAACTTNNTWLMPVSANRSVIRPLQGGISCAIFPPSGYNGQFIGGGTLGGLCVDLEDNTLVGVSNNHVIGGYSVLGTFLSAYTNSYNLTFWSFLSANDTTVSPNEVEYPVYQRSSLDECTASKNVLDNLKIGSVKRAYPLMSSLSGNKLDIAIFALDATNVNLSSTVDNWKQLGLNYNTPMPFATTAEIDSLITTQSGAPVFRSGRTEGPVGWPGSLPYGSNQCSLSCYDISNSVSVNFGGNMDSITFNNQLAIRGTTNASSAGDSGSFACALFNSTNPSTSAWKIIGLIFAGTVDTPSIAFANRIDNIASMFKLAAYTGQTLPIKYTTKNIQVISSRQSAVTAMIGGKMYWQAGSTNMPATTTFD